VKRSILAALAATSLLSSLACTKKDEAAPGGTPAAGAEKKILIGLSLDTLKEERWQRDRDLFVKAAEARGA
jgi:D-xylose transport system substrate-binding protein